MLKLKPFSEVLTMSKEKIDAALAPIRAKQVQMKAELEMAKIEEKLVSLEARTQELCAEKEINFDALIQVLDDYALTERRRDQYKKITAELFPK